MQLMVIHQMYLVKNPMYSFVLQHRCFVKTKKPDQFAPLQQITLLLRLDEIEVIFRNVINE